MQWQGVCVAKATALTVAAAPYIFKPLWIQNSSRNGMDSMFKWMLLMKKGVFIPFDLYLIPSKVFYTKVILSMLLFLSRLSVWRFLCYFNDYIFAWIPKAEVPTLASNFIIDRIKTKKNIAIPSAIICAFLKFPTLLARSIGRYSLNLWKNISFPC